MHILGRRNSVSLKRLKQRTWKTEVAKGPNMIKELLSCWFFSLELTSVCFEKNSIGVCAEMGFFQLELAPASVAIVPYGGSRVAVWKHLYARRYFIRPLAELITSSVKCNRDPLRNRSEVTFDVEMINQDIISHVFRFLNESKKENMTDSKIELVPMEKIRIKWRHTESDLESTDFELIDKWRSNAGLKRQVTFSIISRTDQKCRDLEYSLTHFPDIFDMFELEYVAVGQKESAKTIRVEGKHISKGSFFSNLKQFADNSKGDLYINSKDVVKLSNEIVSSVMVDSVTDSTYIATGDELNVNEAIRNTLQSQRDSTQDFNEIRWESVFWDPLSARPDKIAKEVIKFF